MTKIVGDLFDTVAAKKEALEELCCDESGMRRLNEAKHHWDNMRAVVKEGERCHKYNMGRQWDDLIEYDGKTMTEYAALVKQGFNPRTTNLLNRVEKNVMGVVLKNGNEPMAYANDSAEQGFADVINVLLQANNTLNKTNILWPQQFKQFLEWGMLIGKESFGWNFAGDGKSKFDCWKDNVDPRVYFTDTGQTDVRGWDGNLCGMLHTLSIDDVLANFVTDKNPKKAAEKHKKICQIYGKCCMPEGRMKIAGTFADMFGYSSKNNIDFLFPKDVDKCRVIELWTKETRASFYVHDSLDGTWVIIKPEEYDEYVEAENQRRIDMAVSAGVSAADIETARRIVSGEDTESDMPAGCMLRCADFHEDRYWYYRFMTPTGYVLDEGESPYIHGGHPFVQIFYPFVNGDIRSFMSDLLEEQRNVNRLLTMYDKIMRHSAKGFLAFNKNTMPEDDPDGEELTKVWAQPGGAYGFDLKSGEQIQQQVAQISGNNTNIGIMEMLQTEMNYIEDISGVNGALQGKPGYSTTSGSLYMQQAQNATGSLLDVIEAFYSFLRDSAYKQVENMLQSYDKEKIDRIAGPGSYDKMVAAVGTTDFTNIELELRMLESPSSPVYRQISNDFLQTWLQMGFVDFPTMLQIGHFPFSDKLLAAWNAKNEAALAQGGEPLPDRVQQQDVNGSVTGANIPGSGAGGGMNAYNRMAQSKNVTPTGV